MQRLLFMLSLVSALLPAPALAVALGDELILSRLGDPVEVEIEVLQWEDMDMDRVQISAATEQEYAAFRMTRLPVLDDLSFNLLGPNLDGEVRLLVSSREPLNEAFLELLLVLRWPGGSLLREYVLLFDPPGTPIPPPNISQAPALPTPAALPKPEQAMPERERAVPEPAIDPESVAAAPAEPEPAAEPETEIAPEPPIDVRSQAAIEVEKLLPAAAARAADSSRRSYQVRIGDNLWNIARQFRPAGMDGNLFQVLVSLHDLNRGAFINGNISLLKANAELQIPDPVDIARIDAGHAETTFNERWDQGTQRFDAALIGEALPLFGGEDGGSEPMTEEVFEPVLPPGQELPSAVTAADELIMAANGPTPLQTDFGIDASAVPEPDVAAPPQGSAEPLADDVLPPLIAPSADSLQQMMQAREQQRIALEQQVEAMRIRMQEAQTVAALFNSSLQQAQEIRAAREREYLRNSILLGVLVLALGAGLVLAVVLVFRQAGQLRRQGAAAALASSAGSASASFTARTPKYFARTQVRQQRLEPGFHTSQQAIDAAVAAPVPAPAEQSTATAAPAGRDPQEGYLVEELESLLAGTSPRKP